MLESELVTQKDIDQSRHFFTRPDLIKAQKTLEQSRINISFKKGSSDRYFVISGLINDGVNAETRVSFKKDESEHGILKTNCNCLQWSQETHCYHCATLFIKFHQEENLHKSYEDMDRSQIKSTILATGSGAHVETYGQIVKDAAKLQGAHANSTFSSLQYVLTNNKIVPFPVPENFIGSLKVNFVRATSLEEFKDIGDFEELFTPVFSHTIDGKKYEKISLFAGLYLFNWEDGSSYRLSSEIKDFVKLIIQHGALQSIDTFYHWIANDLDKSDFDFVLEETPVRELPLMPMNFRLTINRSTRQSFLDLDLEIFDDKNRLITPPVYFEIMANENGLLDSFKTKTASFQFITKLLDSFENQSQEYKKHIFASAKRKKIIELVEHIGNSDELFTIDPLKKTIFYCKTEKFLNLFKSIYNALGSNASRFSYIDKGTHKLTLQVSKSQLLNNVAYLYKNLKADGIIIYYDNKEVKTWNSNIRFERDTKNLNWFDLNLFVSKADLQLIKQAQVSDEFIETSQGLVILESDEKELLKFMKKYTLHEKKETKSLGDESSKFSLSFKRARIFELFELKRLGIPGALTEQEEALCEKLRTLEEIPKYPIPERYQELARGYQKTGYHWLRFLYENRFGACLADDMGLGKTLQTIMFLQSIIEDIDKVLVVCPVSIVVNWQNELKKFSDLDCHVYYGPTREKDFSKKIILTSYGVMKKEARTTFKDFQFDILIMDEVQQLKNIRSQGAMAARELETNFRICLTGTPVENDLAEFYNIMDLSVPGIWGEAGFIKTSSTKKTRLLARQTVRPFILRRTKDQVLTELPPKIENRVFLEFSQDEREHYISVLASVKSKIEQVHKQRKYTEILKNLLKLRQLCLWQQQQSLVSTKVKFLIKNLEQLLEEGHQVLVFSQFTTYLDIIQNKIRENSWSYSRIDGSQALKKRAEEVDKFQDGKTKIFLISLKAGGVGLNLTAASYIFLMDPWWNPAVENQAIDRAYRIGQKNTLTVYRPIIKNSVEEKVLVLQDAKRELFDDLMASNESSYYSGKLNMGDFQALLE